jgi:hypothetical protein
MLKIRPENLTSAEVLRLADHEVACGNTLPLEWQRALIEQILRLNDELKNSHA